MIQDIYPKIYHNEYQDTKPTENDFILIFHKNTILVRFQNEKLRYPALKETSSFSCEYYYLFSIDQDIFWQNPAGSFLPQQMLSQP